MLATIPTTLRTISPHFQRSINLTYDSRNSDYIAGYIPTPNGAKALATILSNTNDNSSQRAHVLHAPYGSGKSLLALVLSAIANQECVAAVDLVQERLERDYPEETAVVRQFRQNNKKLLPVILSGDEGSFSVALTRALSNALGKEGLYDLRPRSQYQAALEIINRWEDLYPDTLQRLEEKLSLLGFSLSSLKNDLETIEPEALAHFQKLYPELTAGAHFDAFTGITLADAFHDTAEALPEEYKGIIIIWDEFGRFVEARVGEAFGSEAAQLQSFAEFCNRSGIHQVHLVLITHRLLSGYAAGLPLEYQQEWARIAERFHAHDISSDPAVTYRLIAEAFTTQNKTVWKQFCNRHQDIFNYLTARSLELNLFDGLDDIKLRQQVVERAWPLHPLAVYALPRLARQVAQNERTLFTFLAADEPGALREKLTHAYEEWWLLSIDAIWDYFAEAICQDAGPGGVHATWSGVMYALSKVPPDDPLTESIIKALGVLTIVGDVNIMGQRRVSSAPAYGQIVPTTELLAWALGYDEAETVSRLQHLARRRAVILRRADGYWTFTRGSDVDLEAEIDAVIGRNTHSPENLRRLIERDIPPPFHLPRSYNQEKRMIRFLWGLYRWPSEIRQGISELFLQQLQPGGYADGAVVYVLATNLVECKEAEQAVLKLPSSRAVFVIPDRPLHIERPLQELFALHELHHDFSFVDQDERLPREIEFFIEDARRRLTQALQPLLNPAQKGARWWWHDGRGWRSDQIETPGNVSRLLSKLCGTWFDKTPTLNNESLNQQDPSRQQMNAAQKVIDALLAYHGNSENGERFLPVDLGLTGHGPDHLIMRTLLMHTGLMKSIDDNSWTIERPENNPDLAVVWNIVQKFLEDALNGEQEASHLVNELQSPPYGLRRGVLPVILAATMWPRLPVLTIRRNRRTISPITGQDFTDLCWNPDEFTVEVGPWEERHAALWAVLEDRFQSYFLPHERTHQPLSYLSQGLLRWLQSQPRYCRDTSKVSAGAQRFRQLIYKAQDDPARVFFTELLDLLEKDNSIPDDQSAYREILARRLFQLMDEIAMANQALFYELDRLAVELFASDAPVQPVTGETALTYWLAGLEKHPNKKLETFLFNNTKAEQLVKALRSKTADGLFWDRLSRALTGIYVQDWNDQSVENFKSTLVETKTWLEREISELSDDDTAIELHIRLPEQRGHTYIFRQSDLSRQGQRILQNFKSTLEIAGRPLTLDERRQVVLALLHYVLEGPEKDEKRRNRRQRKK